jgi:hypothetical protein
VLRGTGAATPRGAKQPVRDDAEGVLKIGAHEHDFGKFSPIKNRAPDVLDGSGEGGAMGNPIRDIKHGSGMSIPGGAGSTRIVAARRQRLDTRDGLLG